VVVEIEGDRLKALNSLDLLVQIGRWMSEMAQLAHRPAGLMKHRARSGQIYAHPAWGYGEPFARKWWKIIPDNSGDE